LILADLENLRVETTDLNEIDAARVQVADPVIVTFDALPDVVVNGTVDSIAPKASAGSGVNYTVIILLDEIPEQLRWDMTAFVDIQVE
jgi:multidrug efflux pump subunit AcrA (membrane-fusion protein)